MPTRKYTKRLPQEAYSARSRKGAAVTNSIDSYVKRVVERAGELTPEHIEKLRALLPPVPKNAGGKAA